MKTVLYQIDLLEPVLATALDGDPNSAVSFDYIPGSMLRGAIVGAYMRAHSQKQIDASDPDIRARFFNGTTRFLNGYKVAEGQRSLPVPFSWHQKKYEEKDPVYDFALNKIDDDQLKPYKGFYLVKDFQEHQILPVKSSKLISVHIQRPRAMGRPVRPQSLSEEDETGAVYRYTALEAGQSFIAALVSDQDEITDELSKYLTGYLHLGGARSAGYGLVRLKVLPEASVNWRETGGESDVDLGPEYPDGSHSLYITLLSDFLIRDDNGVYTANPETLRSALAHKLNCNLKIDKAYIQPVVVGGFNRKWGMPLPQIQAMRMGSVVVFSATGLTQDQISAIEKEGFGDRREDGFGRLAINRLSNTEWKIGEKYESQDRAKVTIEVNSHSGKLAALMNERILRQKLDKLIVERAANYASSIRTPAPSQLSRLVEAFQNAIQASVGSDREKQKKALKDFIEKLEKRQATRGQYTDQVDSLPILEWMKARIDDNGEIWKKINLQEREILSIGGIPSDRTPELVFEYNLRLLAATLARAAKEIQFQQDTQKAQEG